MRQAAFAYSMDGDNQQDENALELAKLICPDLGVGSQ